MQNDGKRNALRMILISSKNMYFSKSYSWLKRPHSFSCNDLAEYIIFNGNFKEIWTFGRIFNGNYKEICISYWFFFIFNKYIIPSDRCMKNCEASSIGCNFWKNKYFLMKLKAFEAHYSCGHFKPNNIKNGSVAKKLS